jgi:hypothetical protein
VAEAVLRGGAVGFIPLEESTTVWGAANPCLIMVKPLA